MQDHVVVIFGKMEIECSGNRFQCVQVAKKYAKELGKRVENDVFALFGFQKCADPLDVREEPTVAGVFVEEINRVDLSVIGIEGIKQILVLFDQNVSVFLFIILILIFIILVFIIGHFRSDSGLEWLLANTF